MLRTDQQPAAPILPNTETRARIGGKSAHVMAAGDVSWCLVRVNLKAKPLRDD